MTDRNEPDGSASSPPRAKEFEQGDRVLDRCVVDRCVRRDRLASFYSATVVDPADEDARCTVWSVHSGIVRRSERGSSRFFDEMKHTEALSHPAIPSVIAFDAAAPGPVVIARYAPGVSLRDRLAEGELLNAREVVRVMIAVSDALTALHTASPPIVHRALTPERVLTDEAQVSLEECGYAHALVASELLTERDIESFAQPGYRLPSWVSRSGGAAVDRFMLSVLAFEALTGQLPFGAATVSELDESCRGTLPSARAARPTLPAEIDEVFRRAWREDEGYDSAGAFADALTRVLEPVESREPAPPSSDVAALETPAAQRDFDVERLLPMVTAALRSGERTSSVPPDKRSGRALPPMGRALDLPPSKPTLLGAATGSSRGAVRPILGRPIEPGAAVDAHTPVVNEAHLLAAALSEERESASELRPSRAPDLTDDAELLARSSEVNIPLERSEAERSVVELDDSLLEPSTTNTNLDRIVDEITSFRPSERSALLDDNRAALVDAPDEGETKAVHRDELLSGEHSEARVAVDPLDRTMHVGTPVPGTTLRPPGPALHGMISKKTPLPPLPPYESVSSRGTPLEYIKPLGPSRTPPPAHPEGQGSGAHPAPAVRGATPLPPRPKSGLPTTTPPPTRLNTPIPLANPSARPRRQSVPPGTSARPAVSAPPIEEAPKTEPVSLPRESDALARVAPMIARLTAFASLVATVGLVYAARQLDAYMSDPAYAMREALRPDPTFALAGDAGASNDLGVALALSDTGVAATTGDLGDAAMSQAAADDASGGGTSERDAALLASADDVLGEATDAGGTQASAAGGADAGQLSSALEDAGSSTVPPTQTAAPVRRSPPSGVPGDAVHARVWSQLSRRVADCVEGIDSHSSVTVMVRFDGATGMVQRIRSRGIFAEPPIAPCLEQAVSGIRVAPFSAATWDTTFSFPIAPPRWRPPQ